MATERKSTDFAGLNSPTIIRKPVVTVGCRIVRTPNLTKIEKRMTELLSANRSSTGDLRESFWKDNPANLRQNRNSISLSRGYECRR